MGLWSWLGFGRSSQAGGSLDRDAHSADTRDLQEFVTSRAGVEFYLEPQTTMTNFTVLAIAHDGEHRRRRVASPQSAALLADKLGVPFYEVQKTGYPQRMRDWNAAHPERKMR